MDDYATIRVERDPRGVATVTMDRPEVRNAFDERLIAELRDATERLSTDDGVRVVVLTGAGDVFSAGADLHWMRAMKDYSLEENVADSQRMEAMFRALYELPKPLVGRVNGHALGGGMGLCAVCDVVVAVEDAGFGFTEVLLGIAPAVISPYAVRKIGRSHARALFVSGERFDAAHAVRIGLVHHAVPAHELDATVERVVRQCLLAGPAGAAAAKRLPDLALRPLGEAARDTARVIAELRVSDEGQEGMQAFFDKRTPTWAPEP